MFLILYLTEPIALQSPKGRAPQTELSGYGLGFVKKNSEIYQSGVT